MQPRLTVQKVVVTKSVCDLCEHTRPYHVGDENEPCPACNGGSGHSWSTAPKSVMFPNDVGPGYLRR